MNIVLQCILEKIPYNKNVQVDGFNSEEYKQASEDFRKEYYSQIYAFGKFLCVAYITFCHRSIKIIT